MKLAEAKILYHSGAISSAIIYRPKGKTGWCLEFSSKQPVAFSLFLEKELGSVRIFKKLSAALGTAEKIGVSEVRVIFKGSIL